MRKRVGTPPPLYWDPTDRSHEGSGHRSRPGLTHRCHCPVPDRVPGTGTCDAFSPSSTRTEVFLLGSHVCSLSRSLPWVESARPRSRVWTQGEYDLEYLRGGGWDRRDGILPSTGPLRLCLRHRWTEGGRGVRDVHACVGDSVCLCLWGSTRRKGRVRSVCSVGPSGSRVEPHGVGVRDVRNLSTSPRLTGPGVTLDGPVSVLEEKSEPMGSFDYPRPRLPEALVGSLDKIPHPP